MSLIEDFYYDADGVIHIRRGECGNYSYERFTFVGIAERPVPNDVVANMAKDAISYAVETSSP